MRVGCGVGFLDCRFGVGSGVRLCLFFVLFTRSVSLFMLYLYEQLSLLEWCLVFGCSSLMCV